MKPDLHIDEALNRAVDAGSVTRWDRGERQRRPSGLHAVGTIHEPLWRVWTVDGKEHIYSRAQAAAFADAIFAAEVYATIWGERT